MPTWLLAAFLTIDFGFIAYWAITVLGVIPAEHLFKDYENPILQSWNWSFLPLDLLISATGLTAVTRFRAGLDWRPMALLSLVLTSCSGLQAIAFWTIHRDFDPAWWIPNLFLLLYPLLPIRSLTGELARPSG